MSWRLLLHPPAPGAVNLALDLAILEAVATGTAPATLRLYQWAPACLSIGALQPASRTLRQPPGEPGRDWVRRPSGGRAVFHADEVTYAVVAPEHDPLVVGGVIAAARRIGEALAIGLRQLGLAETTLAPGRRERRGSPACYDAPSNAELAVAGRKLVGSAQLRRSGAVLQHGSIPLTLDRAALVCRLALPEEERTTLLAVLQRKATALAELLPARPDPAAVMVAVVAGFEQVGVRLRPGELSAAEQIRAQQLEAQFRSLEWNWRR